MAGTSRAATSSLPPDLCTGSSAPLSERTATGPAGASSSTTPPRGQESALVTKSGKWCDWDQVGNMGVAERKAWLVWHCKTLCYDLGNVLADELAQQFRARMPNVDEVAEKTNRSVDEVEQRQQSLAEQRALHYVRQRWCAVEARFEEAAA